MEDPVPTFTYIVDHLKRRHPNLAFLHVITPEGPQQGREPEDPAVSTTVLVSLSELLLKHALDDTFYIAVVGTSPMHHSRGIHARDWYQSR